MRSAVLKPAIHPGRRLRHQAGHCRAFHWTGPARASTHKLPATLEGRVRGLAGIIRRHLDKDCLGICIEEPFSGQFSSVKALFPMMGAAVLACGDAGLPYSVIHLSKLKKHATGKGNADKAMMIAAAKERFGLDLDDNAADAVWAAAFAMDHVFSCS